MMQACLIYQASHQNKHVFCGMLGCVTSWVSETHSRVVFLPGADGGATPPCGFGAGAVFAPVEQTLATLLRIRLPVIATIHGAIVADALRVPWVPMLPFDPRHRAKWEEWACPRGSGARSGGPRAFSGYSNA
jgi:hypothetical protein